MYGLFDLTAKYCIILVGESVFHKYILNFIRIRIDAWKWIVRESLICHYSIIIIIIFRWNIEKNEKYALFL